MPITIDRSVYKMAVECDGKKTALGCMAAQCVNGDTRDACNDKLSASGWRFTSQRVLCKLCARREYPDAQ
jgi:hypothetical protein